MFALYARACAWQVSFFMLRVPLLALFNPGDVMIDTFMDR
jgi:hypothetical protein